MIVQPLLAAVRSQTYSKSHSLVIHSGSWMNSAELLLRQFLYLAASDMDYIFQPGSSTVVTTVPLLPELHVYLRE